MNIDPQPEPESVPSEPAKPAVKIFGVGHAGLAVLEVLLKDGLPGAKLAGIDTDGASLANSAVPEQLHLETKLLRGLGSGGDPERGRALAEERFAELKASCEGMGAVFIVCGLGGGAGTGIAPVLARAAIEAGALALAFVATPFDCEGSRRQRLAEYGLDALTETADAVICLPNQRIFKLIEENTSVLETFKSAAELLSESVRALWRLLLHKGLIEIHFADLCEVLKGQHAENSFAVAEAAGATRSRDVSDKLLSHPMLEGGQLLGDAGVVILSVMGGPDLTMAEVNRVVQEVGGRCERAHVIMGAAIDDSFRDRLVVTLIAARKTREPDARGAVAEGLGRQLLGAADPARPGSRILPPPPGLSTDRAQQLLARQTGAGRPRKASSRMRQGQLPLEIVSKGRFDKSEPTIHKGEDLDVPTYIRRGVALN